MIVFKCYMKILRQNVTLVIIYLGIFFSVALVMQMAAGKSEDSLYANASIDIGVVKEDQGVLAQGFVDYLNTIHNVIPMKNDPEVLLSGTDMPMILSLWNRPQPPSDHG